MPTLTSLHHHARMAGRRLPMSDLLTRRRFTVEEYHRMGSAGIPPKDEPVELIAGEIVLREPIGSRPPRPGDPPPHLLAGGRGGGGRPPTQNPPQIPKEKPRPPPQVE